MNYKTQEREQRFYDFLDKEEKEIQENLRGGIVDKTRMVRPDKVKYLFDVFSVEYSNEIISLIRSKIPVGSSIDSTDMSKREKYLKDNLEEIISTIKSF